MKVASIVEAIKAGQFMPSKPIREVRPIDLQRDPEIISSRKHNGNSASVIIQDGKTEFYTVSNILLATIDSKCWIKDPQWEATMRTLPNNTILRGEIYIPNAKIEDLGKFQEWYDWHINKREGTGTPLPEAATFRAFEVLAWNGKSLANLKYKERFNLIPQPIRVEQAPYTKLSQAGEAAEHAKNLGIEGFVFWDANAVSLCKLTGKNLPRGAAWKAKPVYYENFRLTKLLNEDPTRMLVMLENSALEFKCGSGLTQTERKDLITQFQTGKELSVKIAHYGIDETGKPELPTMQSFIAVKMPAPDMQ